MVLPWTQPWSVTKVDRTYKGIKNSKFLAEGSSPFSWTSPAIQWVVEFKYSKHMTMLKNVMSYSVESSSTSISSCSPTSATSTSPEGSSLLYEKANKGLGLAQDFMVQQIELCSEESSRHYKSSSYSTPSTDSFCIGHTYQRTYNKVQNIVIVGTQLNVLH